MTKLIQSTLIWLFIALPIWAQDLPEPQTSYVSDFANLLDPETEARVTEQLVRIREDLDLEMTVVTLESRHDYGSFRSIEEFATTLFNTWGVGNATRNDGVMVLVARSDREMRIELGSSYGPIYDDRMKLVIDHHFIPFFRGNQYAEGIETGVLEIIKRLRPAYNIEQLEQAGDISTFRDDSGSPLWKWIRDRLPIFVFFGIAAFVMFEGKVRKAFVNFQRCPNCSRRQLNRIREVVTPASYTRRGEEKVIVECSHCTYRSEEFRSLPTLREVEERQRRSSSSSGGSFGGGSSSGGGASGRW